MYSTLYSEDCLSKYWNLYPFLLREKCPYLTQSLNPENLNHDLLMIHFWEM